MSQLTRIRLSFFYGYDYYVLVRKSKHNPHDSLILAPIVMHFYATNQVFNIHMNQSI